MRSREVGINSSQRKPGRAALEERKRKGVEDGRTKECVGCVVDEEEDEEEEEQEKCETPSDTRRIGGVVVWWSMRSWSLGVECAKGRLIQGEMARL